MEYNERENAALDEKMDHPEKVVICPRCGAELRYRAFKTAWEVKCPTDGCLSFTVRGI